MSKYLEALNNTHINPNSLWALALTLKQNNKIVKRYAVNTPSSISRRSRSFSIPSKKYFTEPWLE
ncbi:MAG: hypothetical protein ACUVV4_06405 [Candidatus Bathyarchaeia archaeon]